MHMGSGLLMGETFPMGVVMQVARKLDKRKAANFEIYTRAGFPAGAFKVIVQEQSLDLCEQIQKMQKKATGDGSVLARLTKQEQNKQNRNMQRTRSHVCIHRHAHTHDVHPTKPSP